VAGLLEGVLPYIYSQGDRAKRYLGGLLQDPLGTAQQTAGGLLDSHREQQGLLAQAFANQARPFQVTDKNALGQVAERMLAGPLGFAPAGITAWHGSPHVFDKFDSSKIGTGEGAQAYGHGLYLAEAPAVAKQYAGDLAAARATKPVGNVDLTQAYQNMPTDVPDSLLAARRDFRALKDMGELSPADRRDFLAAVKDNITAAQGGALYKVDLPDEAVAKMLDWDKPLSQQPEAHAAWVRAMESHARRTPSINPDAVTGAEAYNMLTGGAGGMHGYEQITARATDAARRAGIPGIRYLDGGSRGAGQGSSNFVVFPGEENILSILERNGVPLR
jgi:hypothetical protein